MSHPGSVAAPAAALRGPDDAFSRASIGIVPILWNNADLPNLVPAVPADHVLDEIARLVFEGTQTGTGYPSGPAVVAALRARDLRLRGLRRTPLLRRRAGRRRPGGRPGQARRAPRRLGRGARRRARALARTSRAR